MTASLQKRLDAESEERIRPLREDFLHGKEIDIGQIFAAPAVPNLLARDSIFLPGSDERRLVTSIPFYGTVLVEICSSCACVKDPKAILPLLNTEGVIPVLINPYSEYTDHFVREVVKLPHIGFDEFRFFRSASILAQAQSKMKVCEHCVRKRRDEIAQRLGATPRAKQLVDQFFWLLSPFVEPDYGLIGQFIRALDDNKPHEVKQIMELAWTIHAVRSSQAFHAAQTIPLDEVTKIPDFTSLDGALE